MWFVWLLAAVGAVALLALAAPWLPFLWECMKASPGVARDEPIIVIVPLAFGIGTAWYYANAWFLLYGIIATIVVVPLGSAVAGVAVAALLTLLSRGGRG